MQQENAPLGRCWSFSALSGELVQHLELDESPVTIVSVSLQNVMFYDMGSGSTVCTIVTYQTVKTKEAGTQPQLQVRGVG